MMKPIPSIRLEEKLTSDQRTPTNQKSISFTLRISSFDLIRSKSWVIRHDWGSPSTIKYSKVDEFITMKFGRGSIECIKIEFMRSKWGVHPKIKRFWSSNEWAMFSRMLRNFSCSSEIISPVDLISSTMPMARSLPWERKRKWLGENLINIQGSKRRVIRVKKLDKSSHEKVDISFDISSYSLTDRIIGLETHLSLRDDEDWNEKCVQSEGICLMKPIHSKSVQSHYLDWEKMLKWWPNLSPMKTHRIWYQWTGRGMRISECKLMESLIYHI